ncbi:hypothetical protein [uncultured Thiothrix sp.]|uniref:hypothetical protein n=1 Tax=uncultured Thiothrix sp. TaxID=223185 RepID=UPI00260FF5DB|nr:hypothetical protein [uncultured Thiothrix sp.]
MKKILCLSLMLFAASNVYAGADADALSKCLVDSTSNNDKTALVRWVFSTIAAHPDIKDDYPVSEAKKEELNKAVAVIYERLLTENCLKETQAVIKNEGTAAFEKSFEVLGGVAVEGLMSNPAVGKASEDFAKYLDEGKLKKLEE